MMYAVAIYSEYTGKNEIKTVKADSYSDAVQMAVDGFVDTQGVTVQHLIGYYWETKKITVSEPIALGRIK